MVGTARPASRAATTIDFNFTEPPNGVFLYNKKEAHHKLPLIKVHIIIFSSNCDSE
jgi:hypothetical protein